MQFDLRRAQLDDASTITDIYNDIIKNTLVTFTQNVKDPAEIRKNIAESDQLYLVVEIRNTVVGFATYSQFRSGEGYRHTVEHSIHLSRQIQRHGIGRSLMEQLESIARECGVHVMVACISSANIRAVKFHKKLGFSQVGFMPSVGKKWDRKLDLILMQKQIVQ